MHFEKGVRSIYTALSPKIYETTQQKAVTNESSSLITAFATALWFILFPALPRLSRAGRAVPDHPFDFDCGKGFLHPPGLPVPHLQR